MTENRIQGINDRRGRTEKERSADPMSLEADYSEINEKAGWEPKFDMKDGIKKFLIFIAKGAKLAEDEIDSLLCGNNRVKLRG